eukprot:TRINITY_DN22800_c0_g1_i1.p1 TRINITY_DN22800_c0_g1~~TRINITY_DN22800_c0_g1_i1.p1  ORF type:complete len:339 (-),score=61.87 TRINITY_DN22800_c0_g1_i1:85-1101(-)
MPALGNLFFRIALLLLACAQGCHAFGDALQFLFVSSPTTGHIGYRKLPSDGSPATPGEAMRTVISSGLVFPQGIAVDEYRRRMFVADPNLTGLVMYPLTTNGDTMIAGSQQTIAKGVQARAVAVDGLGNVVFTDEPNNRILRVTDAMIQSGNTTAEVLYDGKHLASVKLPGGIAADNYYVYWLNKASGLQVGTLLRGLQDPSAVRKLAAKAANATAKSAGAAAASAATPGLAVIAMNAPKCYGVCIAGGNIFYTDEASNLYGIKRAATSRHTVFTISSKLQAPRGCVYDGSGTVYVADKTQNAVFQFASNMQQLEPNQPLTKAAVMQGAFGLAIYTVV